MEAPVSLRQFLVGEQRRHGVIDDALVGVLLDVASATRRIAAAVSRGALGGMHGSAGSANVQGEVQKTLDVVSNDLVLGACQWGGHLAGMASEEMDDPYPIPAELPAGPYLLLFDPLDGSSNIEVNVSIGTIFSVLHAPEPGRPAEAPDFLQPGRAQAAAGYVVYGPSTELVLSVGRGVQGFTLDRDVGQYVLTHPDLRIPATAREYAINSSNARWWEPPVQRWVSECVAGASGPLGVDWNMRWVGSMVADVHRVISRGGVFLYPRDTREPRKPGKLRLMYEANPMAFIVEQAGGAASTGEMPILDVQPDGLHQRVPVILGSRQEVARIVSYHHGAGSGGRSA